MDLKEKIDKLKTALPAVFLCLKDRETPPSAKTLAGITIVYALSPIDLIPDFIPILGYLDDVILLPILISATCKLIPKDVWERNLALAANMQAAESPKKWYYAVPVVLIWILIICVVLHFNGVF